MAEIIVKISKDGSTQVLVNGVAGPGCRDLSSAIEKALGNVVEDTPTAEYYQVNETGETKAEQR